MRKKILVFILVCSLLLTTGCAARYKPKKTVNQNYNNYQSGIQLWLTDDTAYYASSWDKGFPIHYNKLTSFNKTEIVSGNSFINQAFVDNNVLYVLDGPHDGKLCLRSFDVNTKEETIITYLEEDSNCPVSRFFVFNNNAYLVINPNPMTLGFQLDMISLDTLERETICTANELLEVGIVDDKVAYIFPTGTDMQYFFFLYDPTIKETIESFELPNEIYTGLSHHDFTSDYVVATMNDGDSASKIVCYNLHTNTYIEHSYNESVFRSIAYHQYAFMLTSEGNLYRIHLQTGATELIDHIQDCRELYVTSDEDVYVIYESGKVYHYNIDGSRKYIFTMNTYLP